MYRVECVRKTPFGAIALSVKRKRDDKFAENKLFPLKSIFLSSRRWGTSRAKGLERTRKVERHMVPTTTTGDGGPLRYFPPTVDDPVLTRCSSFIQTSSPTPRGEGAPSHSFRGLEELISLKFNSFTLRSDRPGTDPPLGGEE